MARRSILMFIPPLAFAGFVALAAVGMLRDDPDALPSTLIGKPAPPITSDALPGYPGFTPDMLRSGEITLVNFWASWCPPCRAEHPTLLRLQKDGLNIIGVNFKDNEGPATSYLRDEKNPFLAVPFDPKGRTAIDWGVTAPPETFIIDRDGTVLFRYAGPLVGSDFENRFAPALNEALSN